MQMKINLKNYKYQRIDDKLVRTEIPDSDLKHFFKSILLWCFKIINYKHVFALDHLDKPIVKEILDIRGIRTCRYVDYWGQVYTAQFMWKIGNKYF